MVRKKEWKRKKERKKVMGVRKRSTEGKEEKENDGGVKKIKER